MHRFELDFDRNRTIFDKKIFLGFPRIPILSGFVYLSCSILMIAVPLGILSIPSLTSGTPKGLGFRPTFETFPSQGTALPRIRRMIFCKIYIA